MNVSPQASQFISRTMFIVMLGILFTIRNSTLQIALWIPPTLIAVSLIGFLIGIFQYGKYKDVFDYEATTLWGKETSGKNARGLLKNLATTGLWLLLTSILLQFINTTWAN